MVDRYFTGFGEFSLAASELGARHEPSVLVLPDLGQKRMAWQPSAEALADAGRHVVTLDLRGHGDSANGGGAPADIAELVADCLAVLRQLPSRPVVLGAGIAGQIAAIALGEGEPDLASALVLVSGSERLVGAARGIGLEPPVAELLAARATQAAARIAAPALHLHTGAPDPALARISAAIEGCEQMHFGAGAHGGADLPDDFHGALIDFLERRVPRTPPEYVAGSDPRTLRDALGTFATGVTVVTTTGPNGERVGLTANSFTSVSLDPPLLLVCPARDAGTTQLLASADYFAVNVLHIGQQAVSDRFARKGEDRFAETDCETWDHGVPIIRNSLASFECRRYAEYDGGDHVILVGEVLRVRYAPQRDPLLYFRGRYRRLHFG